MNPIQFLHSVKGFNKYNQESWEIKLVRILKYFKGDAKIWADAHNENWADFNEFEHAFKNKYWSEEKQEGLLNTIMGWGNFNIKHMSITAYVTRLYSQVKYLEPPMPLSSFIRYISKHLPKDIRSTIRTREFANTLQSRLTEFCLLYTSRCV